jgi:hypothetical protein
MLFLLLCGYQAPGALAQGMEDSVELRNRIGAGAALSIVAMRDEAGSPLGYSGIAWPVRVSYEYVGENDRHRASIGYIKTGINGPALTSDATRDSTAGGETLRSHTADYSFRTLSYGYARRIASPFDGKGGIFAGALWDNYLTVRYYNYDYRRADDRDPKIVTWEGIFSLNLLLSGEYRVDDENRIEASLHAPFLAFVVRPRYAVQDDRLITISLDNFSQLKNGRSRFVTFGDLLQADASVKYSRSLSRRFDLDLDYRFTWYRYGEPRLTALVMSSFGAGLLFKF